MIKPILLPYLIYEFVTFLWSLKFGSLALCVRVCMSANIKCGNSSLTKIKFRMKFMWRLSFLFGWISKYPHTRTYTYNIDNIRPWKNLYDGQNQKLYAKWHTTMVHRCEDRSVRLFSAIFWMFTFHERWNKMSPFIERCFSSFLLIFIYCLRWH